MGKLAHKNISNISNLINCSNGARAIVKLNAQGTEYLRHESVAIYVQVHGKYFTMRYTFIEKNDFPVSHSVTN